MTQVKYDHPMVMWLVNWIDQDITSVARQWTELSDIDSRKWFTMRSYKAMLEKLQLFELGGFTLSRQWNDGAIPDLCGFNGESG